MITVTVKRNRWGRGGEDGLLYCSATKKMCCLGFVAREVGLTVKHIKDVGEPDTLPEKDRSKVNFLLNKKANNNAVCCRLMAVNDSAKLSDVVREEKIITLGKKVGIAFKFVDK